MIRQPQPRGGGSSTSISRPVRRSAIVLAHSPWRGSDSTPATVRTGSIRQSSAQGVGHRIGIGPQQSSSQPSSWDAIIDREVMLSSNMNWAEATGAFHPESPSTNIITSASNRRERRTLPWGPHLDLYARRRISIIEILMNYRSPGNCGVQAMCPPTRAFLITSDMSHPWAGSMSAGQRTTFGVADSCQGKGCSLRCVQYRRGERSSLSLVAKQFLALTCRTIKQMFLICLVGLAFRPFNVGILSTPCGMRHFRSVFFISDQMVGNGRCNGRATFTTEFIARRQTAVPAPCVQTHRRQGSGRQLD